jgi:acetate kinase
MNDSILVINAGSSSLKFAVFPAVPGAARLSGEVEGLGRHGTLSARDARGEVLVDRPLEGAATHQAALEAVLKLLGTMETRLVAAGHRIVHGGRRYADPAELSAETIAALEALSPLAPQHQPHNLAAVQALRKLYPDLLQIACFDTAFHADEAEVVTTFAIPRVLTRAGVRRYGFHGLSYQYIADVLPTYLGAKADGKVIVAHLGHGSSMCAMQSRRSVATTMGFSALDGLMMGTRCGALDPGVILYLLRQGFDGAKLESLLYEESGLLGVSELSDDMRDLLASSDERASEAVALYVYRIVREIGSLAAALGGLDSLIFTGGIGEHSAEIRARACRSAAWLGARLDEDANAAGGPSISKADSAISIYALATSEETVIAQACRAALSSQTIRADAG